jgi:hypothetical protein
MDGLSIKLDSVEGAYLEGFPSAKSIEEVQESIARALAGAHAARLALAPVNSCELETPVL